MTATQPTTDSETRERIIREARGLFLERGYDGAAMSALAKRSGVTTPALYWHFDSKAELCAAVIERDYRNFYEEITARTVGITAEQRLRAFVATYVELTIRDRDQVSSVGYNQLRDKVSDEVRAEIKAITASIIELLQSIMRDGRDAGEFSTPDFTVTTYALITMCEYVYVWYRPGGRLSPLQVGALYAEYAYNLVRPAAS